MMLIDSSKPFRVGLIGAGIQHSSSPALHMDEARAQGFSCHYELMDMDKVPGGSAALPQLLARAEHEGFLGVNITYPSKQAVMPLLHELSSEAAALQSVNTVLFREGRRIGHNTDWWGFAESFRRGLPAVDLRSVVLVGAGGAGSAVGYALLKLGVQQLSIHDVDPARSETLAQRLQRLFPDRGLRTCRDIGADLRAAAGLVHATPTGMQKLPGLPVPAETLRSTLWVAEVVYVPLVTELLRVARHAGCRTLDGSGMAVFQAAMAFELFCGLRPDAERMLRHFQSNLATAAA